MAGAVVVLRSWTRLSRHSASSSSLILTRSNSDNAPQRSSPSPRRWSQNTTDTQQPRPSSNNRQRSSSNNNYSYQDRRQQQQQQHPNQQHNQQNNNQHRFQNQPRHHQQPQQHSQQQHQAQHRHQQQHQHRHQHPQDRYQQQDRHQQQDRRQHPQQHSQDRHQQHPQQQQQNHHHDNRRRNAGPPVAAALSAHTHDSAPPPPPSNPSDVIDTEWTESSGGGNGNNGDGNDQRGTERSRRPRVANSPYGEGRQGGKSTGGGGGVQGGKSRAARASVAAAIGMKGRPKQPQAAPPPPPKKQKTEVFLPSFLTVSNLARVLGIKLWDLQVRMRNMGHDDIRPDLTLPFTDAELIAAEFNLLAIANDEAAFDIYPRPPLTALSHSNTPQQEVLPLRPPVVTIMGHVDHGKTTLLDKLRSTSVAAGEAGGITQHIGAFSVPVQSSSSSSEGGSSGVQFVTFLDTPGHAAFTAMRSRGASVTDIVVLVVAADDGVMPQTKEVIELWKELSAREASFDPSSSSSTEGDSSKSKGGRRAGSGAVQLVVALSKSDKPTADPERVKRQLLSEGIELEEYGGEVPCVAVSGKSGEGLDLLQDTLVTLAELAELRAEQSGPVEGYVVESKVEKGRGNVATVLVKRGALRVGDVGVAGTTWAKVRSMTDSAGLTLRELRPGQAGVVTGWKELPSAGDEMLGAPLEQGNAGGETAAKRAVENRKKRVEAAKLGEDVAQINEQRRVLAEEQERKKRAEFVERQQKRLAEAALAAGKSVEQLIRENKLAGRLPFGDEDGAEGAAAAVLTEEGKDAAAAAVEEDKKKELLVIVKADVSGSAEAVIGAISGIGNKEAGVRIVSSGVGEPTEGDLAMARAVGARIIAFNVSVPRAIERAAASYSPPVPVHSSPIIYRLMEYVSNSVGALLPPVRQIRVTGEATIAQIFKINVRSRVFHNVAGCRVTNGTIARSSEVRILRPSKDDGIDDDDDDEDGPAEKGDDSAGLSVGSDAGGGRKVVWMGKLDSLKHGKNEVPERGKGTECGMSFEGFQSFQEGDVVQCFYVVETPRQLM